MRFSRCHHSHKPQRTVNLWCICALNQRSRRKLSMCLCWFGHWVRWRIYGVIKSTFWFMSVAYQRRQTRHQNREGKRAVQRGGKMHTTKATKWNIFLNGMVLLLAQSNCVTKTHTHLHSCVHFRRTHKSENAFQVFNSKVPLNPTTQNKLEDSLQTYLVYISQASAIYERERESAFEFHFCKVPWACRFSPSKKNEPNGYFGVCWSNCVFSFEQAKKRAEKWTDRDEWSEKEKNKTFISSHSFTNFISWKQI